MLETKPAMRPTSNRDGAVTPAFLKAIAEAWNRHDADALMSFMTRGSCVRRIRRPGRLRHKIRGTRYVGWAGVRAGYSELWATFPDAHWARHFECGERGMS